MRGGPLWCGYILRVTPQTQIIVVLIYDRIYLLYKLNRPTICTNLTDRQELAETKNSTD